MTTSADKAQALRFKPQWAALGTLAGVLAGCLHGADWPDAVLGGGLGFVLGGAAPLLARIWQYLAVFFALTGGFVWLLVHYLR